MSYPTYTDCDGKERQLDAFHLHELLDRAHVARQMFEDFVVDHPAAKIAQAEIDKASRALGEAYQAIGRASFDIEQEAGNVEG